MHLADKMTNNSCSVSDLFHDHLSTDYVISPTSKLVYTCENNVGFTQLTFTLSEIYSRINAVKSKLSIGPHGILFFLKRCLSDLAVPLRFLYNLPLSSKTFPSFWKDSFRNVIHKSGDRADVTNYRVCINSEIAKLFDKPVTSKLSDTFNGHIATEQHGFVPGRSTVSNIIVFQYEALNCLDAIYTDFAFDKVNHSYSFSYSHSYSHSHSDFDYYSYFIYHSYFYSYSYSYSYSCSYSYS